MREAVTTEGGGRDVRDLRVELVGRESGLVECYELASTCENGDGETVRVMRTTAVTDGHGTTVVEEPEWLDAAASATHWEPATQFRPGK